MSIGFNNNYLNKNIYTRKMTIDSFDRNKKYIPNNKIYSDPNNYQINLHKYSELQKNIIGISLISAFIPNSEYLINNNNNKIDILFNNIVYNVELEKGNFDSSTGSGSLREHLETALSTQLGVPFTVELDTTTHNFTIKNKTSEFTLLLESGDNCNSYLYETLGLEKKDITSTISGIEHIITTNHINVHSSKYVDIVIEEIPRIGLISNTKDNENYILDRIYFDNNYGNYKLHYANDYDRIYNFFNAIEIKNLTIKLYNDKNFIYDSNNLDNVISLEFIILKNDLPSNVNEIKNEMIIIKYLKEIMNDKKKNEKVNKELINTLNKNNQSFNKKLIEKLNNYKNDKQIINLLSDIKSKDDNENLIKDNQELKTTNNFNFNNIILTIIIICLLIKIFIN